MMLAAAPTGDLFAGISEKCGEAGECQLIDIITVGVNASNYLLGIVGMIALALFIYGGVVMVMARGDAGDIKKAKGILLKAVIGLLIVFSAYAIVTTLYSVVTGKGIGASIEFSCTKEDDGKECGPNMKCQTGVCLEVE